MPNPAQLLHETFVRWNAPSQDARAARGLNGQNWEEHTLAIRHLSEIEELIRLLESQGRNMRVNRATLPVWYQTVFAYDSGWAGAHTGRIDQQALNTLELLAERLQDVVAPVIDGGIEQILEYVDSVAKIAAEDTSLPPELRSHINDVIEHVRWCATNYNVVGDFSLQDALERLSGAIVRGASQSANKSWWKSASERFVYPFVVNAVAALPAAAIQIAAISA